MSLQTFTKDPDDVLDYVFDWTRWLDGDTISTSTMTTEAGLTEDSDDNDTEKATVWVSGGTAGTTYTVANKITTANGRTAERTISIRVEEK